MVCAFKQIPYEYVEESPFRRPWIVERTGQRLVPVVDTGDEILHESTAIAMELDARYPEPPLLPSDPAARSRALLWEDWADEALVPSLSPLRFLIPASRRRAMAEFRQAYPKGIVRDVGFKLLELAAFVAVFAATRGIGVDAYRAKLDRAVDLLEACLSESKYLAGDELSLADLAVYSGLAVIAGLEGWERVVHSPNLIDWWQRVSLYDKQPPFAEGKRR